MQIEHQKLKWHRLTESQSTVEPCIPIRLSSNKFMNFFNGKIALIRDKLNHHLSSSGTDLLLQTSETAIRPGCLTSIDVKQLISAIILARPATCLLVPIPTRLLRTVLLSVNTLSGFI